MFLQDLDDESYYSTASRFSTIFSEGMSVITFGRTPTSPGAKKIQRKRKRKRVKRFLQIVPCCALLVLWWVITHFQNIHQKKVMLEMEKVLEEQEETRRGNDSSNISSSAAGAEKDEFMFYNTDQNRNRIITHIDGVASIHGYPFNGLADVTEPMTTSQTALFWQIPKTGGTTLKHIFGNCLNLVQASRISPNLCDVEKKELHVCKTRKGSYVNADTSDINGIQRAIDLNLIPSGLTDVIVSSRFLHALALFDIDSKARAFTAIRDPIERAVSTFYHLQKASLDGQYDAKYKEMTLLQYVQSDDTPSNWMVRWLTGKQNQTMLTDDDLNFAKELLRKKFIILLTEEMRLSFYRLTQYMNWSFDESGRNCIDKNLSKVTRQNKDLYPEIEVGSDEYKAIREKNSLDIELYNYALELFSKQWKMIPEH